MSSAAFFTCRIQMKPIVDTNKNLDTQAPVKSIAPDQMLQNVASSQDLHCLPLIQQFLGTWTGQQ